MSKTILITGAGSGIGRLAVRELMAAGHRVYAGIREIAGRNEPRARELSRHAASNGQFGKPIELDVLDDASTQAAAAAIVAESGSIDVLIHNAAHLYVGVTEAFSSEQLLHSFDTNAVGSMRVNRAVLPHMRQAQSGYVIWVGSGVAKVIPPFIAPYAAAKAAQDALADALAAEIGAYGIDTTILMPGPFVNGTEHFPKAEFPSDQSVSDAYDRLADAIAANADATTGLYPPDADPDPIAVARELVRLIGLPADARPFRSAVDFSDFGDQAVSAVADAQRARNYQRMGLDHLLRVRR